MNAGRKLLVMLGLVLCGAVVPLAQGRTMQAEAPEPVTLASLAAQALADDPAGGRAAVPALRERGPAAVEAVLAAQRARPAAAERFREVLDRVCAQRDCAASHLFWYTDLVQAEAEARRTGRPILSLRLLGRLDEDMSCANSRFFRTVLYANGEVSRLLRERFVLHWRSVRPVPRITIDFGDGRSLRGTITGNSVHYVLDPAGRLVDALPGLYGPGAFKRLLEADLHETQALSPLDDPTFALALGDFHRRERRTVDASLRRDLVRVGASEEAARIDLPRRAPGVTPTAYEAAPNAQSKMSIEIAPLSAMSIAGRQQQLAGVDWARVADLHREAWRLDAASLIELERKHGEREPKKLRQVAAGFERLVGVDTVRNEYVLHTVIHAWMSFGGRGSKLLDLESFNDRVYADLFLTPGSDPWLGLAAPETFMALDPALPAPLPGGR